MCCSCVHWMDGWVTGLAATTDDGGEQWPDVDVGFMLARTLHTASCSMYVDRGKGQVAQRSAVVAVALWRLFVVGVPEAVWERFVLHRVVVVVRWRTWLCSRWRRENVGLLRGDCALWNRGYDSVCAPPCGVHWMDGWVTGSAATADERRRTMAGCGRGVHACVDAAHGTSGCT